MRSVARRGEEGPLCLGGGRWRTTFDRSVAAEAGRPRCRTEPQACGRFTARSISSSLYITTPTTAAAEMSWDFVIIGLVRDLPDAVQAPCAARVAVAIRLDALEPNCAPISVDDSYDCAPAVVNAKRNSPRLVDVETSSSATSRLTRHSSSPCLRLTSCTNVLTRGQSQSTGARIGHGLTGDEAGVRSP